MDITLTLDHYAIVSYICEYMMKDESGTMEFIKKAVKEASDKSLKDKMKDVKNCFLTHRQAGVSEALYKVIPSMKLSGSNVGCAWVHCGFRHNRSRMLREVRNGEEVDDLEKIIIISEK